ncbi:Bifunctional fatty acid transporter/acyl-CoA synthetase (FAT1) [Penicillium cf. viridicatum]|uniref:Bifunctional fatty acid transporter/acyl-CoA synthetase (FAT1) n=1 Tax=Penicillium cf. viridicatum TaxID=2972119 RepID=A0A9W9J9A8_9EURO|nr:Bifunctional fatty acid transporter/acyl-CoA synthetase (FAT1) [Penicillium cf. viridicatum]
MPPSLPVQIPVNKVALAASAAVAAFVGGLYADHSHVLSYDINQIIQEKALHTRLQRRINALRDDFSLYHMLQLAERPRPCGSKAAVGHAGRLACHFVGHGLRVGDTIAIFATKLPEMVLAIAAANFKFVFKGYPEPTVGGELMWGAHIARYLTPLFGDCWFHVAGLYARSGSSRCEAGTPSCNPVTITLILRYEDLGSVSLPAESRRPIRRLVDVGALIYTSGTRGKPKAVGIKNFLLVLVSTPMTIDVKYRRRNLPLRTYSCLPLFHATCLFSGLFYSVGLSATFCLARKFYASRLMARLVESRATRLLYVGELCRYLLAAPASPHDRAHQCRVAIGNGLHRNVWRRFQQRFNIPEVREVYRSTEGVAKFDNFSRGKTGAGMVGCAGPLKRYFEDVTYLVRYDPTTESPYRDPQTGLCVLAQAGEPGEAIGRVRSMDYYNEEIFSSERATCSSGIRPGGFASTIARGIHSVGENVSAAEVREHICKLPDVEDASVYTVKLSAYDFLFYAPGWINALGFRYDGQAGAAAISLVVGTQEDAFATGLFGRLRKLGLAMYQLPKLVRFSKGIETTATFKQSKAALKGLAWNPEAEGLQDSLYWLDGEEYRRLDSAAWGAIEGGKARL